MPIVHPIFGERTLIQGHWYTTAQMEDVGRAWEAQAPDERLFCISEHVGHIGLTSQMLVGRTPPLQIICPVNQAGNHWTSVAIHLTVGKEGNPCVRVGYADSLLRSQVFPLLLLIQLTGIFSAPKYNSVEYKVYSESWLQKDYCSCGPYALENARRFLEGKGSERNPGQAAIREKQLLTMSTPSAVTGCSVSVSVTEALTAFLIQRFSAF